MVKNKDDDLFDGEYACKCGYIAKNAADLMKHLKQNIDDSHGFFEPTEEEPVVPIHNPKLPLRDRVRGIFVRGGTDDSSRRLDPPTPLRFREQVKELSPNPIPSPPLDLYRMCGFWVEYGDEHSEILKDIRVLVNRLRASGADVKVFVDSDMETSEKLLDLCRCSEPMEPDHRLGRRSENRFDDSF